MLKRICSILVMLSIITAPIGVYADEMSDYMIDTLNNLSNLTPHAYEGQQRGYFIGGSLSTRIPNDVIQPFSYTPPQFHVGCNGIDVVMGGFSYLNFDYIIQKLQSILQAAPFLAFDIAIQTLCEQCRSAMNAAEHFSQLINKLNFSSCKSAEALVAALTPERIRRKIIAKTSAQKQKEGQEDGFWSAIDNAIQNVNSAIDYYTGQYDAMVNGVNLNAIQPYNPSLIQNAASATGLGGVGVYLDFLRAVIGDVVAGEPIGGTNNTLFQPLDVAPCYTTFDADTIISDFLNGHFKKRSSSSGSQCEEVNMDTPVVDEIQDRLSEIYDTISSDGQLTQEQINLINASSIPVYSFLKLAYMSNEPAVAQATIEEMGNLVATNVIYTAITRLTTGLHKALTQYKNFAGKEDLVGKKISDEKIDQMLTRIKELRKAMYWYWQDALDEFSDKYNSFLDKYRQEEAKVMNALQKTDLARSYQLQGILTK